MKKLILWAYLGLILTASITSQVRAQYFFGSFNPNSLTFIDSLGAKTLTFTTTFNGYGFDTSGFVYFVAASPGITFNPGGLELYGGFGQQQDVKISVNLDSVPNCWASPQVFAKIGNSYLCWLSFIGYVFDPKIVGRVLLRDGDSLNFGSVPIGADISSYPNSMIDTPRSIFRKLLPLNIQVPFSSADSIVPDPGGCPEVIIPHDDGFHFHPTEIGHYVDTVFLYDPIRKDSTMLILLGECVDAGVTSDAAEANSLRINPNPCDHSVAISLSDGDIEEVTVQNILGERVLELHPHVSGLVNLNTSVLPAGIYYVEVRSGEDVFRQRIVVRH